MPKRPKTGKPKIPKIQMCKDLKYKKHYCPESSSPKVFTNIKKPKCPKRIQKGDGGFKILH